ncbi:MAG: DUF2058 family protein [Myxococcales bacterium]|nr:DUF2058 family protein [Myxococcales bacterium]
MQGLKDKLIKAGLVTEEQAREVEAEPPRPGPPGGQPPPMSKALQRLEAQRQRELDSKLLGLVLSSQVTIESGPRAFYFVTRKGKLRRLDLCEEQARALEEGKLAVVERQEPAQIEHSLVPAATAEQMARLSPKSVRFLHRPGSPVGFLSEDELRRRQAEEELGGASDDGGARS